MIARAPAANDTRGANPGHQPGRSLAVSNSIECRKSCSSTSAQPGHSTAIDSLDRWASTGVAHARRGGQREVDLVPGEDVAADHVDALADGVPVAEQRHEARGRSRCECISVHSEVPSPCTTTGRPARIRSIAVQPASTGTTVRVVGVERPHDRQREAAVPVGVGQQHSSQAILSRA